MCAAFAFVDVPAACCFSEKDTPNVITLARTLARSLGNARRKKSVERNETMLHVKYDTVICLFVYKVGWLSHTRRVSSHGGERKRLGLDNKKLCRPDRWVALS